MSELLMAQAEEELSALRVGEALRLFNAAELTKSDPDACAAGRWECHMLSGDFGRAWHESDMIHQRGRPDPNRFWTGRPLDGKRILIRCLHGLGDTIQFVRYAPLLRAIARSVVIEAPPKLKITLAASAIADDVITWSEPEPDWDQQIEVMELPRIFRTTLETIPRQLPYIHISRGNGCPLEGDSNRLRVGIAWTSSTFNPARSIAIQQIAELFDLPGISFFGLQSGPEHHELSPWLGRVYDFSDHVATIHDTARVLKTLHLVVTVDTMTAHLAGSLAIPVWTLLPYRCDWRWMLHRNDSPWYPTMRLFRQPEPGDWSAVIEQVKRELKVLTNSRFGNGKAGYSSGTAGTVK